MGSTAWSDSHYVDRKNVRLASGKATFAYDADIREGRAAKAVHVELDAAKAKPTAAGFKGRESRDSDKHPTSRAIVTMLDVTGSMSMVPKIVQANLPKLMGLLTRKGYIEHPHILTMAIGDVFSDSIPLQVGQFEAGIEIENDLTNLFLEGGGGGTKEESYDLGLYFLANHTSIDCFEKRKEKGYVFVIGDERLYKETKKIHIEKYIDVKVQDDVPLADTLAKVKEKYEVYFILPAMTHHYNDHEVIKSWTDAIGEDHILKLQDPNGICELIASIVGISEGKGDLEDIDADLADAGSDKKIRNAIGSALAKVEKSGKVAKRAKGVDIAVAESGVGSGVATL